MRVERGGKRVGVNMGGEQGASCTRVSYVGSCSLHIRTHLQHSSLTCYAHFGPDQIRSDQIKLNDDNDDFCIAFTQTCRHKSFCPSPSINIHR